MMLWYNTTMKQDELVATNIRLPKTQLRALKQKALKKEKSVNFLIRQLIERYVGESSPKPHIGYHAKRSIWDFPKLARKTGDRRLTARIDKIVYGGK